MDRKSAAGSGLARASAESKHYIDGGYLVRDKNSNNMLSYFNQNVALKNERRRIKTRERRAKEKQKQKKEENQRRLPATVHAPAQ